MLQFPTFSLDSNLTSLQSTESTTSTTTQTVFQTFNQTTFSFSQEEVQQLTSQTQQSIMQIENPTQFIEISSEYIPSLNLNYISFPNQPFLFIPAKNDVSNVSFLKPDILINIIKKLNFIRFLYLKNNDKFPLIFSHFYFYHLLLIDLESSKEINALFLLFRRFALLFPFNDMPHFEVDAKHWQMIALADLINDAKKSIAEAWSIHAIYLYCFSKLKFELGMYTLPAEWRAAIQKKFYENKVQSQDPSNLMIHFWIYVCYPEFLMSTRTINDEDYLWSFIIAQHFLKFSDNCFISDNLYRIRQLDNFQTQRAFLPFYHRFLQGEGIEFTTLQKLKDLYASLPAINHLKEISFSNIQLFSNAQEIVKPPRELPRPHRVSILPKTTEIKPLAISLEDLMKESSPSPRIASHKLIIESQKRSTNRNMTALQQDFSSNRKAKTSSERSSAPHRLQTKRKQTDSLQLPTSTKRTKVASAAPPFQDEVQMICGGMMKGIPQQCISKVFLKKIENVTQHVLESPIWYLKNSELEVLSQLNNLSLIELNGIVQVNGYDKMRIFSARLARLISLGQKTDTLYLTKDTNSSQQTVIVNLLEEAQFTAAISTWKNWDQIPENERSEREQLIINYILRIGTEVPTTDAHVNNLRLERLYFLIKNMPKDIRKNRKSLSSRVTSKSFNFFTLPEQFPYVYQDLASFRNMLRFDAHKALLQVNHETRESPRIVLTTYAHITNQNLINYSWGLVVLDDSQQLTIKELSDFRFFYSKFKNYIETIQFVSLNLSFKDLLHLITLTNPGFMTRDSLSKVATYYDSLTQMLYNLQIHERNLSLCLSYIYISLIRSQIKPLILKTEIIEKNFQKYDFDKSLVSDQSLNFLSTVSQSKFKPQTILNNELKALTFVNLSDASTKNETYKSILSRIDQNPLDNLHHSILTSALIHHPEFQKIIERKEEALILTHLLVSAKIVYRFLRKLYPYHSITNCDEAVKKSSLEGSIVIRTLSKFEVPKAFIPKVTFFLTSGFGDADALEIHQATQLTCFNYNTTSENSEALRRKTVLTWNAFFHGEDKMSKEGLQRFVDFLVAATNHKNFMEHFAQIDGTQFLLSDFYTKYEDFLKKCYQQMKIDLIQSI